MDRRDFLKHGCTACISLSVIGTLVQSCTATQYITGRLGKDGITIKRSDFRKNSFLIVRHENLQYPIGVYRLNENEYSALWMKCTHQGATLQASGDVLQCPAHGSEFNNNGGVIQGPASTRLRTFPVTQFDNELFIDLRKQA